MSNDQESSDDEFHQNFTSIIDGTLSFLIGSIASRLISFVIIILMTRVLSVDSFGVFTFMSSIAGAIAILGKLGSDKTLLKLLPKHTEDTEQQRRVLTVAIVVILFGLLFAVLVILGFKSIYNGEIKSNQYFNPVLNVFILILCLNVLLNTAIAVIRSLEYPRLQILIKDFIQPIFRGLGIVITLYLGYSIVGVAVGVGIGLGFALLIVAYIVINYVGIKPTNNVRKEDFTEFLNFSLPVTLQDSGTILYKHVDILMVGWLLTATDVAIYKVAFVATAYFTLPLAAFGQIFTPIASRLYESGEINDLRKTYRIIARWIITVVLFPSVAGIIYRQELLSIFGQAYSESGILVVVFILSSLVVSGTGNTGSILVMTNNQYYELANSWVFGILNIILNYILILEFGVLGAVIATSTTTVLSNVTGCFQLWYLEKITPVSMELVKPFTALLPATVITYLLSQQYYGITGMAAGTIIGFSVYIFLIYLVGIPSQDKEIWKIYMTDI
ncbi:MAG: lipopolysaccharide biosynthesis protein [Candidatus Paceibacteria bacterium]